MKPELFTIGSFTVHSYGLLIGIGVILCTLLGMYRAKKRDKNQEAVLDLVILCVVVGFLGAKLLYVIVEWDRFLRDPMSLLGSEGFVVYGGIIAGVLAAMAYCRWKKIRFLEYFDLVMPGVALAQGFGRIGCFMAGCCYGRETDSFLGVVFPEESLAPAGVKLLPTQLFSAAGDFLIVLALLWYEKRARHTGDVGAMYLLLYGVGRFCIEFLRADERGGIGVLSTSQIISVFIVAGAAFLFRCNHKKAEKALQSE